jgi:hypothetical protein
MRRVPTKVADRFPKKTLVPVVPGRKPFSVGYERVGPSLSERIFGLRRKKQVVLFDSTALTSKGEKISPEEQRNRDVTTRRFFERRFGRRMNKGRAVYIAEADAEERARIGQKP